MDRSKGAAFQYIIDSIQHKMEGWRAKTLSQAGRLVLIKAVAAAVPSYAMSTFLLPKGLCRKLDQVFKNFWWGFLLRKSGTYLLNPGTPSALLKPLVV
jgi:hypothetical protein